LIGWSSCFTWWRYFDNLKEILISSSCYFNIKNDLLSSTYCQSHFQSSITSRLIFTLSPLTGSSPELYGDPAPRACGTGRDQTYHQQAAWGTRQLTQRCGNPETRAQWIQGRACCLNNTCTHIWVHKNNHYKCTKQHLHFAHMLSF